MFLRSTQINTVIVTYIFLPTQELSLDEFIFLYHNERKNKKSSKMDDFYIYKYLGCFAGHKEKPSTKKECNKR